MYSCIPGENTNLYVFQRYLTSLAWQRIQWRLPFLLFSAEGILGHWRREQQTVWWVDFEWFWLIGELLAQKISRAPFLLQMSLAAVSNRSYLTMKHGGLGIVSLFHSYPQWKTITKKQNRKRFLILDSWFGKVTDVSRSSGLDVQRHWSAKLYMIKWLVPM